MSMERDRETQTEIPDFSSDFVVEEVPSDDKELDKETDPHRISQRQRQIDFGKNTIGYQRYLEQYPKNKRPKGLPRTPDVYQKCSKRSFDGQVRKWRRQLHEFDLPVDTENPSHVSISPLQHTAPSSDGVNMDGGSNPQRETQKIGKSRDVARMKGNSGKIKRDRTLTPIDKTDSPSMMLPDKMQRRWADMDDDDAILEDGWTQGESISNEKLEADTTSTKLMMKWKDMLCKNLGEDEAPMDVLVSYSDDEY